MRSVFNEIPVWRLYLLQSIALGALLADPAFAAKGQAAASSTMPLWLKIYKMVPPDAWTFIAVIGTCALMWLLFFQQKDCKCKCGVSCKCACKCSASCPCIVPLLKLKR